MRVELIATGSELVNGDIINTNTAFLASELKNMGFDIAFHTITKDSLNDLQDAVQIALKRCKVIIVTGGLGPTTDDLTKTAIANLLGLKLVIHQPSLERIREFFSKRNRVMPESNIQQAILPIDGLVLENSLGTAPGIVVENRDAIIIMLPGPPFEMKAMFIEKVKPYLLDKYKENLTSKIFEQRLIKLGGIGESKIQDFINDLNIDNEVEISYRAQLGEIIVKLLTKGRDGKDKIIAAEKQIVNRLNDYIYSFDDTSLEFIVGQNLLHNKLRVGIAESCTGGLLSHKLTNVPGSSSYLSHGIVSYSNEAKNYILKVKPSTLSEFTAVSKESAMEMAQGVKEILNVDIGISITGYAGGTAANDLGYSDSEKVGLVYIGLVTEKVKKVKEFYFSGDRLTIKEMAAQAGLFLLWKYLANISNNK